MKRLAGVGILALGAALCGADRVVPPANNASEIHGIELRFDTSRPTFGQAETPAFSVRAETGVQKSDLRQWSLEDARATIYRKSADNLQLVAKSMTFDTEKKEAQMGGGVRVTSGRLVVEAADMSWDDTARVAKTDSFATLDDGANRITGKSISIFPDNDLIQVGGGTGSIRLAAEEKNQPPKPEAADAKKAEANDKFDRIDIKKYEGTEANLSGRVRVVKGPAQIELVGKDPADTIKVDADLVTFDYATDGDNSPSVLEFKGHVLFTLSQGTVRTDLAKVDFSGQKVEFRKNVAVELTQINGKMDKLDLNLDTRDIIIGPGQIVYSLSFKPAPAKKP
jgi:hypothetical protein